jgi:hypothetical protein
MMLMNNEQTNTLRMALKDVARLGQCARDAGGRSFYEEFSRLNNELANMQRELAKKISSWRA